VVFTEEDKTFIKILYLIISYGQWTTETWVSSLAKDEKCPDWITQSCLQSGRRKCKHNSGIPQTVRMGLINERRDRRKASVLVNGGHFERW